MDLKSALVLCIVSVFCACEGRILFPAHYNRDYNTDYYDAPSTYRPPSAYLPSYRSTQTEQTKEWNGKEYNVDDQNKKFYVSDDAKNWFDARDACKKMGMVLASPTTRSEEDEIEDYLERNGLNPTNKFGGYWLGGHRVSQNEPWIWESNGQELLRFGWMPGEPNGYEGEDCVEFKKDYGKGWNNYYCVETRRYICQPLPYIHESDKNIVEGSKGYLHEEELKMSQKEQEDLSADSDDDYSGNADLNGEDDDDEFNLNDYIEKRRQEFERMYGTTESPQEPSSSPFENADTTTELWKKYHIITRDFLEEDSELVPESGDNLLVPAVIETENRGYQTETLDLGTGSALESSIGEDEAIDLGVGLDSVQESKDYVEKLPAGIPSEPTERILVPKTIEFVQVTSTEAPYSEIVDEHFYSSEGPVQVDNLGPSTESGDYNYDDYGEEYDY